MSPLTLINYPLDKEYLISLAESMRHLGESYTDKRMNGQTVDYWKVVRFTDDAYVNKMMADFGVTGRPRFYYLKSNSSLGVHTDLNTTCSLNFVLSDDNPAPVTFDGIDYYYTQCLLNTTLPHSVTNGPAERLLFKISLFDEPYEEIAQRLPYKLDAQI